MKRRPPVPKRRRRDPERVTARPDPHDDGAPGNPLAAGHQQAPPAGLGPYEAAYDISRGYRLERSILLP